LIGRLIKYWLPVALTLAATYVFSTDLFSGDNTRGLLVRVLSRVWPQIAPYAPLIHYVLRKAMHFAEYAVLAWLLFRAFRGDSPLGWRLRWVVWSLVCTVLWSILDELHQTYTLSRAGSIYDSIIDSAGGLCSLLVISARARSRATKGTG
jgi:VanZ family protein